MFCVWIFFFFVLGFICPVSNCFKIQQQKQFCNYTHKQKILVILNLINHDSFYFDEWNEILFQERETLAQYFVSFSTSSWWWWWWHVNNKQRLKKKRIIIMIISPLDSMIVNDGSNNVLNRPETLVVCVLDHRKKWKEQIFVCIFRCF